MKIVEVQALSNGAHRNQTGEFSTIPDGWALIPEDMTIPASFPFVGIEAEEVTHYKDNYVMQDVTKTREVPVLDDEGNPTFNEDGDPVTTTEEYTEQEMVNVPEPYTILTVTSMTEGVKPEPGKEWEFGSSAEDDLASMLVDHEYRLTLMELGLAE